MIERLKKGPIYWINRSAKPFLIASQIEVQKIQTGETTLGVWRWKRKRKAAKGAVVGDSVLFIPGLGDSPWTWLPILATVSRSCSLASWHAIDLPGFSGQFSNFDPYDDFGRCEKQILAIAKSIRPQYIVGHSLGGWLGARVALDPTIQKNLKRLFLLSPSGLSASIDEKRDLQAFFMGQTKQILKGLKKKIFFKSHWWTTPLSMELKRQFSNPKLKTFFSSFKEEYLLNDTLKELPCPVSVMWGQEDNIIPSEWIEAFAKRSNHPGSDYTILPRAGHAVQVENPVFISRWIKNIILKDRL